jgi:hypothetical protein
VILHGPMSSLLQDRFPFMTAGLFYCGIRVEQAEIEFFNTLQRFDTNPTDS